MGTGKRILRTPELLWAGAFCILITAIRIWLIRPLSYCGTPDACFYLGMAQNLATGHGFHTRFLYDFQQAHLTLPNTGLEYWRPGISLILLLLKPFGGVTLHGSILLTMLVGILFSAAAWHIAMHAYGDRRLALGGFALCLTSPTVWTGALSSDSGMFYGAAVAWFLALFTVRRQGSVQDLLALGCVCIAYFVRNDAALLLLPLLAVLWQRRRTAARFGNDRTLGTSAPYATLMILGFFLALVPMHLLYRRVLGTAFPTGTSKALYLNDLSDLVRYGDPVSLRSLLSHGIRHLVVFRIATFATVVYRIAALMIGYAALVFFPGLLTFNKDKGNSDSGVTREGSPLLTRLPECTGAGVFFLGALLAYTLVLPAVGGFSALRTAEAVIPLAYVLVLVAILRTARTPRLAWLLVATVIGANTVYGFMDSKRNLAAMNEIAARDRVQARELGLMGADPATAVVMTGDPVQFSVTTGYTAIALPVNGLGAMAHAAHDFRVTHVILDTEALPATSDQVDDQMHPVRSATLPADHTFILELPPEPAK